MLLFEQTRDHLAEAVRHIRPYQAALAGLGAMLLLAVYATRSFVPIALLGVAIGLLLLWGREFVLLMQASDDEFPGRFDKPIWALAILLLPPIGIPAFRAFRHASRIEPKPGRASWGRDHF